MSPGYRRGKRYYVRVPNPEGGSVEKSTRTGDRRVYTQMVTMCQLLHGVRAHWPILRGICSGREGFTLPEVYAAWTAGTLEQLHSRAIDVDLQPTYETWAAGLRMRFGHRTSKGNTVRQYTQQVRAFFLAAGGTDKGPWMRSLLDADRITAWLSALTQTVRGETKALAPATKLRYWAALSSFCQAARATKAIDANPMDLVSAPSGSARRERHLTFAEQTRVIDALPDDYRMLGVLAHLGIELGAILTATVRDVDLAARTIHAHGTKEPARDRLCVVGRWAMPALRRAIAEKLPDALLQPTVQAEPARAQEECRSVWYAACAAVGTADYRIHDARHTCAVLMIRKGAPSEVVAQQLGHTNTNEVNERYGRYRPSSAERMAWIDKVDEPATESATPREDAL